MQEAVRGLEQAIASGGGVLLHGEPGSGRELFARAIHLAGDEIHDGSIERVLRLSMRGVPNGRPFVVIDCSATVDLESRLFGTRASADTAGLADIDRIRDGSALHEALGGTLVLRQLPELPARLQTRLARVLRDREVWVEGDRQQGSIRQVSLRPIATLDGPGDEERIVPELRTRLSKCTITMPALRRRREDIPALVRCALADLCASRNVARKTPSSQAANLLAALPWRGNLLELNDLLSVLIADVPGRLIRVADVLANIRLDGNPVTFRYAGSLKEARERFEREYVTHMLEQHHGRIADAAKALGIQRTNLYRKLRKLSVRRNGAGQALDS